MWSWSKSKTNANSLIKVKLICLFFAEKDGMTFSAGLSDCRKRCRRKPEHELPCQGVIRAAVRNLLRPDFRFVVHRRQRKLFRPQRQPQGERDRQRRLRSLQKPLGPGNRNMVPSSSTSRWNRRYLFHFGGPFVLNSCKSGFRRQGALSKTSWGCKCSIDFLGLGRVVLLNFLWHMFSSA